jgi:hypothetical protein
MSQSMPGFFRRFFKSQDKIIACDSDTPHEGENMIAIQERIQRATESILENEALTTDLDDHAAEVLLDWGVALAQQIAGETIEMDDLTAEEFMYQPMRALRRMLRTVNKWVLAPDETELERIVELARIAYGPKYVAPNLDQRAEFAKPSDQWSGNPSEIIRQLQRFLENQTSL